MVEKQFHDISINIATAGEWLCGSHQKWDISGGIAKKIRSQNEKNQIRNNRKKSINRASSSLLCLCFRIQTQIYILRLNIQTNGQYLQTNSGVNTIKVHCSEYWWTYLFRRRTETTIPTMLTRRSWYLYLERNCSQRF